MAVNRPGVYLLECDIRPTVLGLALRVQVERYDDQPMTWAEVYAAFSEKYPGMWAVQVLPPTGHLMDGANKYHLFVLEDRPTGMDISLDAPPGTVWPKEN